MNNRPDPSCSVPTGSILPKPLATPAQRLDDYLDHLCAPLIGHVPYEVRCEFRTESRAHLECLVAEYEDLCMSSCEACETALREFGDPCKTGRAFVQEWNRTAHAGMRRTQTPGACALAWFGAATVVNVLIFERYALFNYETPAARFLSLVAGSTPLIAGLLTGMTQPVSDGRAVLRVQGWLALFTLLLGLTLLPHVDLLILAGCQLLWWLPAGYVATLTTANLAQRLRRPRFRLATAPRRAIL